MPPTSIARSQLGYLLVIGIVENCRGERAVSDQGAAKGHLISCTTTQRGANDGQQRDRIYSSDKGGHTHSHSPRGRVSTEIGRCSVAPNHKCELGKRQKLA